MALNNTSKIVGLNTIAQNIENDLTTLSATLYTASEINTEIMFNITADAQEYSRLTTTTNTAAEEVLYTPGILERVDLNVSSDPNMSMYNEAYVLTLYGYYSEMEDVRILLDKYTMEQKGLYNDTDFNSWLVKKSVQSTDYAAPIDPNDGSGVDRFMSVTVLLYSFIDGGIHSSKAVLEIDAIRVPFYSLQISHQKDIISVPYASSDTIVSYPKTQGISYGVSFPMLDNDSIKKIAREIAQGTWGNTYLIDLNDTVVDTGAVKCILTGGTYSVEQNGIVIIDASFLVYNEVI